MDISPIKKSASFPGSQEISGLPGNFRKKASKSLLRERKKDFSDKPGRSERKNSLTIVPIESIDDNKDSRKKKNKDMVKLFNKEIVPVSEDISNMFSSVILYDFSSEVFFQAKKFFQEKDALLKQTIEFANEDRGEFLKDFPEIQQGVTCLTNDKNKKTFIISSSINSYINEKESPLKDL